MRPSRQLALLTSAVLLSLLSPQGAMAQTAATPTTVVGIARDLPPPAPLGRLFLTPERRTTLERQRQLNIAETLAAENDSLAVNGVVQRSNGRSTVWLNQRAQRIDNPNETLTVHTNRQQPGTLSVKSGDAPATNLKVGESLNRSTQERNDVLAPGAIRVGKPRP